MDRLLSNAYTSCSQFSHVKATKWAGTKSFKKLMKPKPTPLQEAPKLVPRAGPPTGTDLWHGRYDTKILNAKWGVQKVTSDDLQALAKLDADCSLFQQVRAFP